ncbi:RICIN domain-containing protein [Actinomycetota bacterium Odt1-20B]
MTDRTNKGKKRPLLIAAAATVVVAAAGITVALHAEPHDNTARAYGTSHAGERSSRQGGASVNGAKGREASRLRTTDAKADGARTGFRAPAAGGPEQVRYVINKESGKCLTVQGASKANGAVANQYRCVGAANQKWHLESTGGDPSGASVVLRNRNSGKCLTVHGGVGKGHKLTQWECLGQDNQIFGYIPGMIRSTKLISTPVTARLVVDVQGGSHADNAPVIMWRDHSRQNQMWDLSRKG